MLCDNIPKKSVFAFVFSFLARLVLSFLQNKSVFSIVLWLVLTLRHQHPKEQEEKTWKLPSQSLFCPASYFPSFHWKAQSVISFLASTNLCLIYEESLACHTQIHFKLLWPSKFRCDTWWCPLIHCPPAPAWSTGQNFTCGPLIKLTDNFYIGWVRKSFFSLLQFLTCLIELFSHL